MEGWSDSTSTQTLSPNDVAGAGPDCAESNMFQACSGVGSVDGTGESNCSRESRSVFLKVWAVCGGTRSPLIRSSGNFRPPGWRRTGCRLVCGPGEIVWLAVSSGGGFLSPGDWVWLIVAGGTTGGVRQMDADRHKYRGLERSPLLPIGNR